MQPLPLPAGGSIEEEEFVKWYKRNFERIRESQDQAFVSGGCEPPPPGLGIEAVGDPRGPIPPPRDPLDPLGSFAREIF